jgi:hypothetical protein
MRACLALFCLLLASSTPLVARAQSNDGFHTLQVIPIVVDSASFTQQFTFRSWLLAETPIAVRFHPGTGQAQAIDCPDFTIPTVPQPARITFASLRDLCPTLPPGAQFGLLYLRVKDGLNRPFAAYSRVSNAQGIGFGVEAFPPHLFTHAPAIVSGIRRKAATPSSPAFQTNCFLANLAEVTPSARTGATEVFYGVFAMDGTGPNAVVALAPGQMVRLLDVFSAAGFPSGDVDEAEFRYLENSSGPATPIVGFCTVQDNTSFGADFRIAKPDQDFNCNTEGGGCDYGMGDAHVLRETRSSSDTRVSGVGRVPFEIPAGPGHQNSHVFYFRHPDTIGCKLRISPSHEPATPAFGLEMRLMLGDAVLAGGDGAVGFSGLFLGDKFDLGDTNQRYVLQVESNGQNEAAARPYIIHCESGSGHTRGDTILRDRAVDDF